MFYTSLQMTLSLYCSTPSSLIIVDEFGKGTTEVDGLALLASCLDHFLSRGVKCPHVLAATHFHDVVNLIRQSRYLKLQVSIFKEMLVLRCFSYSSPSAQ
jgi:DNA mismatch repair protein MSH5